MAMVTFLSKETRQLLHNKFVVILGDSSESEPLLGGGEGWGAGPHWGDVGGGCPRRSPAPEMGWNDSLLRLETRPWVPALRGAGHLSCIHLCLLAVQRSVYKDLVLLLQKDELLSSSQLRDKVLVPVGLSLDWGAARWALRRWLGRVGVWHVGESSA